MRGVAGGIHSGSDVPNYRELRGDMATTFELLVVVNRRPLSAPGDH